MSIHDKCPKCGASRLDVQWVEWVCGNHPERHRDSSHCLTNQRDQLAATLEAQRRGAANAERLLCEALGVESGADVLDAIAGLRAHVKRLEEYEQKLETAGDTLATVTLRNGRSHEQWRKAKEAKP